MIRLTRVADYAIMVMTYFARNPQGSMRSARDLAREARLPLPTVSKILKVLAHNGMLDVRRGAKGGFTLALRPDQINVADIISIFEGPMALTACTTHSGDCVLEVSCPARVHWQKINRAVHQALKSISLAEMVQPFPLPPARSIPAGERLTSSG